MAKLNNIKAPILRGDVVLLATQHVCVVAHDAPDAPYLPVELLLIHSETKRAYAITMPRLRPDDSSEFLKVVRPEATTRDQLHFELPQIVELLANGYAPEPIELTWAAAMDGHIEPKGKRNTLKPAPSDTPVTWDECVERAKAWIAEERERNPNISNHELLQFISQRCYSVAAVNIDLLCWDAGLRGHRRKPMLPYKHKRTEAVELAPGAYRGHWARGVETDKGEE